MGAMLLLCKEISINYTTEFFFTKRLFLICKDYYFNCVKHYSISSVISVLRYVVSASVLSDVAVEWTDIPMAIGDSGYRRGERAGCESQTSLGTGVCVVSESVSETGL